MSRKDQTQGNENEMSWDLLLSTTNDSEIARLFDVDRKVVGRRRKAIGVPAFSIGRYEHKKMEYSWLHLAGTMSDAQLAKQVGLSSTQVSVVRKANEIAKYHKESQGVSEWAHQNRLDYQKRTQKALRNERQIAFNLLKQGPCVMCGKKFHPFAMDFDHIDPTQKIAKVGSLVWGLAHWDKVLEEVSKCRLLCACCHRLTVFKVTRALTHQHTFNRSIVTKVKSSIPCADCGGIFESCQMDFDHLDPSTKNSDVARLMEGSTEVLFEEIRKCSLVCANCHRVRSHLGRRVAENTEVVIAKFLMVQSNTDFPKGRSHSTMPKRVYRRREKKEHTWLHLVGTMPDVKLAKQIGFSLTQVSSVRKAHGIAIFHSKLDGPWVPLLGTMSDYELASQFNKNPEVIRRARCSLGIPPHQRAPRIKKEYPWLHLVGTMSDASLAEIVGLSMGYVARIRDLHGILPYSKQKRAA